ncbi:uncharacterized protein LOC124949224 [Vespa velutina]|uniref:uncharacterized protein LOC124422388 n=1 Tax=Vespa crabro TaxID=7445 RepID=UPI001F002997|nr:uncharacterized protein LOC124422388 [Vespa crabro]XP_046814728.1 uncharacterized protein LOC124422388 [Vespa crabro]XP_046814729.1 uncharacterized protein LOC124422388 [Vespa crabro]XP_046814730.1 uncharacterized protein LOC124422388 [Vespa crabro]XP_046814731.1 uncharacterized protein LOC124422388 [Vespa crabro]XP_047349929.1 uncharacterized protein LOC124949224 [Vespa velutina]
MSKYCDILPQIQKADLNLKMILDEISKMRVKCAQMQLEILCLYKPQCLQILEMLKTLEHNQNPFIELPFIQETHLLAENTS